MSTMDLLTKYKCETCHDTGWCGDNGPGRKGNSEYVLCDCQKQLAPPYTNEHPVFRTYEDRDKYYFLKGSAKDKQEALIALHKLIIKNDVDGDRWEFNEGVKAAIAAIENVEV